MTEIRAILNSSIKKLAQVTIFSVTFIKKNGEVRHMQCRTGVKKYLNPNSKGLTDNQKKAKQEFNHLTVVDMGIIKKAKLDLDKATPDEIYAIRPYRNIPCDRVLEVKAKGLHLQRGSITDQSWNVVDTNV